MILCKCVCAGAPACTVNIDRFLIECFYHSLPWYGLLEEMLVCTVMAGPSLEPGSPPPHPPPPPPLPHTHKYAPKGESLSLEDCGWLHAGR